MRWYGGGGVALNGDGVRAHARVRGHGHGRGGRRRGRPSLVSLGI